ncbi:porin [Vibrio metschnikovii]|uniref:Porin n=3 Tax=Unclassified Bacteria TaxID=49928 RepID=A0AAU6SZK2_UNCXX|nr:MULTISPECIES: porin [Vibrio]EKO3558296.1 porin [Vibrio metschnikovii]EKO3569870.1 porin [Vibrio metschnikovii]EKO3576663.1 porin [Vibrio metschnikovii]EKO3586998.1 porin [Vibrio metschnikovii]EKO3590100.1 porin [Vibrio metschnikovii]
MDKMFKRTLLGAAVALASIGAVHAAQLTDNVQIYGQAAGNLYYENKRDSAKDDTIGVEIESRIGLRGTQSFNNFSPDFVWQIETGNAGNGGGNADGEGSFGGRDTFLGFDFHGVGTIKVGRQLVSIYDYVDWPHSNPGLGNVFDWHNGIGASYQDRANHVVRFDSADLSGFKYSVSVSKMESSTDDAVVSFALAYNGDGFGLHGGAYLGSEITKGATKSQEAYYLIGGNYTFTDKLSLTAAWKHMTNEVNDVNRKQDAFSATLSYWATPEWLYKVGYAATTDAKWGSVKQANESQAITARALYVLDPSAVLYFDVRNYDLLGSDKEHDQTRFLAGVEYYF